ncbi:MAG: hemolysin III family protein [Ruminococcus sp.]|nr:hemolysin III family protein [Ruminococcus sp.]
MAIRVPKYSLSEELINAISHGLGAIFGIVALVLMLVKASRPLEYVTVSIYGTTMIILYVISTIYHSLSPRLKGKKVLRVIDHCNVYLLVFGTYIPVALLGVRGILGWILFGVVAFITTLGITFTAINIDKYSRFEVFCHLVNGWSIIIGIKNLYRNSGFGLLFLFLGGVMYSFGSILYSIGASKKYMHSVFHFFCLAGTVLHFICVYGFLL